MPADAGLLQWAVQIGGPMGALLVIFGYFYRKDMKANTAQYREDMKFYTDQMKQVSDEWKGQSALLLGVVKENTVAFTQNTAVVQSLHSHIANGGRRQDDLHK
jgi:hypothetical protein